MNRLQKAVRGSNLSTPPTGTGCWVWDGDDPGKELRNLAFLAPAFVCGWIALLLGRQPVVAVLVAGLLTAAGVVAFRAGYVRVGLDRLTRRGLRGFSVHMSEVRSFRYTPKGMWYVETARGLHPLGAGVGSRRLIDAIRDTWPHLPCPSPTRFEAAHGAGFRGQSIDGDELRATLRLPNLPDDERVRVAELVAHDRDGAAEVEAVAEACLDPVLKARLLATVRNEDLTPNRRAASAGWNGPPRSGAPR